MLDGLQGNEPPLVNVRGTHPSERKKKSPTTIFSQSNAQPVLVESLPHSLPLYPKRSALLPPGRGSATRSRCNMVVGWRGKPSCATQASAVIRCLAPVPAAGGLQKGGAP